MSLPGYDGEIVNPLSIQEGIDLTIALGRAHKGNDYDNADVHGRVLHFGGVNYLEARRDKDPEEFQRGVDAQIEELQAIVEPHIGKWVTAKHKEIGVKNGPDWELWERPFERPKVMHISGIILGVAGLVMERVVHYDYEHPGQIEHVRTSSWRGKDFRIGVLLDTSKMRPVFCYGVEAPQTDRMLLPIRGLPRTRQGYNGIWSWQLHGHRTGTTQRATESSTPQSSTNV